MLHSLQQCIKAYINDIIIFFKILKQHTKNLKEIFKLLIIKSVILDFSKCFLNYLEAKLLNIKMFMFDIITVENKLKIITLLKFSQTLHHLKIYFKKTEYFKLSIAKYV